MLITVRDSVFQPVEIVEDHGSLEWTDRWLDVGGWILTVPTGTPAAVALLNESAGITVTDDSGAVLLSGPVSSALGGDAQAATRDVTVAEGLRRDMLTFTGTSDMVWLRDRITVPGDGDAYDDRSGIASTVILGYIEANTQVPRGVAGLVLPEDPTLGATVDMSTRYDVLLDVLREAAELGGVGFTLGQVDRTLVLGVSEPVDRSADVRFGLDLGNIAEARIATSPAKGTVAYMAGQGEGAGRLVEVVAGGDGRRIERFVDRRDLELSSQLVAAGGLWLGENGGALSVQVDPVTSTGARFGADYGLGDLVTLDLSGSVTVERVSAVTTTVSVDGTRRAVTLGSEPVDGTAGLLRAQALLSGRVSLVERR